MAESTYLITNEPLKSRLFNDGFKNDETPLDEYNLNILIDGITYVTDNINAKDDELYNSIAEVITNYQQADANLETKIIGNADDTVEDNTLNGVINEINDINDLLNSLEDTDVITTPPSVTISSTNVTACEVGTTITPDYKITFNAGKYEYGPNPTGCTVDTSSGKGWHASFNGESLSTQSGSFRPITVADNTDIKLSIYCDYTQGSVPMSDLSRPIENSRIPAGKTTTETATLSGYRQVFFGSTTSSFTLNSATIRGLALKTHTKSTASSFTMNIVEGAKQVLIAVPSNRKLTAVEDKKAFGTNILTAFATSTLTIAGADNDPTSQYAGEYTLYIYIPDASLSANTYTVTLANA